MLTVLRQRNFALVWFGGLVSITGDWMLRIAAPVYVYRVTGSTLATGASVAAVYAPQLLFGSLAGVFVDRWDRRRTMAVANLARAGVLLPLLLVASADSLWIVYAVTAAEATIGLFFGPAENALLPRLVGDDRLMAANSLNSLNNNLGRLLGPPLGALTVAFAGLGGVAAVDAATYVVGGILILLVNVDGRPDRSSQPPDDVGPAWLRTWRDWTDGLGLVARDGMLRVLFVMIAAASLGEGFFGTLFVPFVTDVLGGDDAWVGWLMTSQAVGGLIGAIVVARYAAGIPPRRLLGGACVVFGLVDLVIFNARLLDPPIPTLAVAVVLIVAVGIPAVALGTSFATLMQLGVSDAFRGRVFATLGTSQSLLLLAGVGIAGTLGDIVGVVPLLSLDAALYVAAGLVGLTLLRSPVGARSETRESVPAA
ncbi:MAG: MFS transporter [Chloroflexota bacterium]|nr:MFS transporter [Chloroflexota bacterium]